MDCIRQSSAQRRAQRGAAPPPASAPLLSTHSPSSMFSSTVATMPSTSGSASSTMTGTAAASAFPPLTGSTLPSTSPAGPSFVADDRRPSSSPRESTSPTPTNMQTQSGQASALSPQQQQRLSTGAPPTDDEVEAVIRMATSTRPTPDGRPPPGKDTRTQLFVGNVSPLFFTRFVSFFFDFS